MNRPRLDQPRRLLSCLVRGMGWPRSVCVDHARKSGWKRPGQSPGLALFASRDFRWLWAGQVASQLGDGLSKLALLWFVYQLTGSALKMTVIGILQTIPPLLLGPLLGVYVDRISKKGLMITIDLIRAVLIVLIPVLHLFEILTLEALYVLVFLNAIVSAAFGPALAAAVPGLVSPFQLTAANSLVQSAANVGVLVGPAMSGLLIALIGVQNVLYVDAATFLISAACLLPVRIKDPAASATPTAVIGQVTQDLTEGLRYVFVHHRKLVSVLATNILFCAAASTLALLLPVFAKNQLGVGSIWLGWLWSALGAGMLAVSLGLACLKQQPPHTRLRVIAGAMLVGFVTVAGLIVVPSPWTALGLLLMTGATMAVFTPLMWTLLQEHTPDFMRGRVFALMSTAGMASSTGGMALFGWIADGMGATMSLFGIACLFLGTGFLAARASRQWELDGMMPREENRGRRVFLIPARVLH